MTALSVLLSQRASKNQSQIGFVSDIGSNSFEITWADDQVLQTRIERELLDLGIESGLRVGLMMHDQYHWSVIERALLKVGCCIIGCDKALLAVLPRQQIKEEIDLLIVDSDGEFFIEASAQQRGLQRIVIQIELNSLTVFTAYSNFKKRKPKDQNVEGSKGAITCYTSGSGGVPKRRTFTQVQAVFAARELCQRLSQVVGPYRTISWLPLSSIYQRMFNYCAILLGNTTFFLNEPSRILEVSHKVLPHYFPTVPYVLESFVRDYLTKKSQREDATFLGGSLKFLVTGSAPLEPRLVRSLGTIGVPVIEGYGMTECIIPIAMHRAEHNRPHYLGLPFDQVAVKVGKDQQLCIRSIGLALEIDRKDLTTDGYFLTQDRVKLDENGGLTYLGRLGDSVKSARGRHISLLSLEEKFSAEIDFEQCAVIVEEGSTLIGVGFFNDERAASSAPLAESLQLVNRSLHPSEQVRKWLIIKGATQACQAVRTRTGKLNKIALLKMYQEQISQFLVSNNYCGDLYKSEELECISF